jgi:DNA-binding SARP family transcriptional activator
MIGLRPKASQLYLERRRLLDMLPDEAGYVVWLEAPYGYGKSVLASQWAEMLEREGWRTVWLSLQGRDARVALCWVLELAAATPWGVVLERLWNQPTLVVLEDLDGSEDLTALLDDLRGLVLLASRHPLPAPALPRLVTEGKLVHLASTELAFKRDEAERLFAKRAHAHAMWRHTQGWALPLHFAALTGKLPQRQALLAGMRASVSDGAWEELLFLSVLSLLPQGAANGSTTELARAGFIQRLEQGYRVHPLVGDEVRKAFRDGVQVVVRQKHARLPPLLRAEAFEGAGLHRELAALLESDDDDLSKRDPQAVLRWDALAPLPRGLTRSLQVGWSLWAVGKRDEAVALLLEAAVSGASADKRLLLYKDLVWVLSQHLEIAKAKAVASLGEAHLSDASPEVAGRFLNNVFNIYYMTGAWGEAMTVIERALAHYPPDSPFRQIALSNAAILRWHQTGDFETVLRERGRTLTADRTLNPSNVPGDLHHLAELNFLLNRRVEALGYLEELPAWKHADVRWTLRAQALQAYLQRDESAFAQLCLEAQQWEDAGLSDRIRFYWARTLRELGKPSADAFEANEGNWQRIEKALAQCFVSGKEAALAALGETPPPSARMELRVYWQAAHYLISREERSIDALCGLTLAGATVLPVLVPLDALPRNRPELAASYPLDEVLASPWRAAIERRLHDLPPLELSVLGRFEVRVLGKSVDLPVRQKEIVTLLSLGLTREEIGTAIWPDIAADKVRNNLHVQLNRLRKALEPWGVASYLFEDGLKNVASDWQALQRALERGDGDAVLRLYHEPLAPGLDLPHVTELRETLRQEVIAALFEATRASPAVGADRYLVRLLELDPLHEEALQRLLAILLSRGRRREARRRYHAFAERLRRELALEPLPETRALVENP